MNAESALDDSHISLNADTDWIEFPFVTPDNKPIEYSLPWDKFRRTRSCERFFNFELRANPFKVHKAANLKLLFKPQRKHLFELRSYWYFCVDIDHVIDEDVRFAESVGSSRTPDKGNISEVMKLGYMALCERMQDEIGNKIMMFNSVDSHRPKGIMCVKYPTPVKCPNIEHIRAIIKEYFPKYFAVKDAIDLKPSGIFSTFVPYNLRAKFMAELPLITPIELTHSGECTDTSEEEDTKAEVFVLPGSTFKYTIQSELPKEFKNYKFTSGFEKFVRVLCAMANLTRGGFGISQLAVARTLGISQPTVSLYLKEAINLGLLKVKSHFYQRHTIAKTYIAARALKKAILARRANREPFTLPKKIRDGNWHSTLVYASTRAFRGRPDAFMSWFKTIPGHTQKDRAYQALGISRWLASKFG